MTLKDLSIDHDYYASEVNYYSNEAGNNWAVFDDFYEEYKDSDVDMNLIYRWDIEKREDSERYYAKVFIIHQRKGIYAPHIIEYLDEQDVPKFIEFVTKHWEKLVSIWQPISKGTFQDGMDSANDNNEQWNNPDY